jgi:hypothetical protein
VTGLAAGVASFEDQAVITGGTGRFAGATGQFRITGEGNLAAMTFANRLSGTITRADDDEDDDD